MSPELFDPALYARALRLVKSYVVQNCGTIPDAEDIMQDGLLVFFQSMSKNGFILSTKPEFYIFSVCKKLWLKELNRRKIGPRTTALNAIDVIDDVSLIQVKERNELLIPIIQKNIKKLSSKCQKLFDYRKEGLTCEQIAEALKLRNGNIAKDKYYRCKKRLLDIISEDQEYKNLFIDGEKK